MKAVKMATLAVTVVALAAGGIFYLIFAEFLTKTTTLNEPLLFEVQSGATFAKVSSELEKNSAISNKNLFELYAYFQGARNRIKVGEYQILPTMTPSEILRTITSGKSFARSLTVSEGLNIFEIADLLEKNHFGQSKVFLKYVRDPQFASETIGFSTPSLEGYLFPETYLMTKYMDEKTLIQQMVKRFRETWQQLPKTEVNERMNIHQIVTLASIIEKETGADEERFLISSVFHNRLKLRMKLQTDPTILYGLALIEGKLVNNIKRVHLTQKQPYNTYQISGLPPGPIANPGKSALEATLQPANSEYLYFVSQNNGTHTFSVDYTAHERAVRAYQLNPKAREGRSWRDLQKKKAQN